MQDSERRAVVSALTDLFRRGFEETIDDTEFDRIARRVFAWQFTLNAPYAAFCERRGVTPADVDHWTRIPAVPTGAFREVPLIAGDPARADVVFRTSGTTLGTEKRGAHYVRDLSLYHLSLIPSFAACVLPDGAELTMLSLVPPSAALPDSSLSHMVAVVLERLGGPGSGWFADAQAGIEDDALATALEAAVAQERPVCLLGTSFAFVHWLDRLAESGTRFRLPDGSRVMDTGGYKGRSRAVEEGELRRMYHERLGIPDSHCVNEYGMTEMCSQFYDSSLRDTVRGRVRERRKIGPPWVRTRVVDPETLEPLSPGQPGLLQHFDLANADSVCAIQTDDIGIPDEDGFRILGRAAGAVPRGCSIAMDILLDAIQARRS